MESVVEVAFFRGGTQADSRGWTFNRASQHPDITDLGLDDVLRWVKDAIALGKDIYGEQWSSVETDTENLVKDVFRGKNVGKTISSKRVLFAPGVFNNRPDNGPGVFPANGRAVDEARVTFRAWSEDDLTTSFGRVDPQGKIRDLGERRFNQGDNHVYEHSFSIPLENIPPGPYFFTFGSGDSGTIFNVGVTSILTLEIAQSRQSGFLIQGRYGVQGNFELVVPFTTGGLAHFFRDNDAPGLPWHGPFRFGDPAGQITAVSLIQSNFSTAGRGPGNLELVVRTQDGRLLQFFRPDAGGPNNTPVPWQGPFPLTADGTPVTGVSGTPALIQSRHGGQGNFELVVPLATGGLAHFFRDNDAPGLPWHGPFRFGDPAGQITAVSLIQSNFSTAGRGPGNLELVVRTQDGRLLQFFRPDAGGQLPNTPGPFQGPSALTADGTPVTGVSGI